MTLTEIAIILAQRLNMQFDEPFVAMTRDIIKLWDATITIQRLDSKPDDRQYFTQSIVLELERLGEAECSRLGYVEECIMKTKLEVPELVRTNVLFDYVGAENFANPYTMLSPLRLRYKGYNRGKAKPKFIERNKHIYVFDSTAEKVGITSVFADPEQIKLCGVTINKEERECLIEGQYKRPKDIIQKVIQSISAVDYRLQAKDTNDEQITPNN